MSHFELITILDGDGCGCVVADHFKVTDSYRAYRPHGMTDCLFTYTLEGHGYFITSEGETTCKAGDVVILNANVPHRYGTVVGKTWDFVWVHFAPQDLDPLLLPKDDIMIVPIDNRLSQKRLYDAFMRVVSDSRESGDYWNALCMSALTEILLLVARRNTRKIDPRIEETIHLMSRHMREPLRVEALAKKVGLSPSRLSFLFKQSTGLSIVETFNNIRIHQAALLLENTDRNASEVAYDVGYNNYNHFINQFRRRYGEAPSVFAKAHRQASSFLGKPSP